MPDITITVGNATWTKTVTAGEAQTLLERFLAARPNRDVIPGSQDESHPDYDPNRGAEGALQYTDSEWVVESMRRELRKTLRRGKKILDQRTADQEGEVIDD